EVEVEKGDGPSGLTALGRRAFEARAIRQAGELVGERELLQLGRSLALRRYVEQVALPLQRTPVRVADRGRLVTHPHCSSVACDQPVLASRRAVALGFEPDLV